MSARPALGRGLNALISGHPASDSNAETQDSASNGAPYIVAVSVLQPNPDQPRMRMDPAALEDLAASIREHGILQPILVTRDPQTSGQYLIVAGERRWRAAQLAGLSEVPVIVTELTDRDRLAVALVENVQREDLSPLEEAYAYQRLLEDSGFTQDQVAKSVGKSRVAITNTVRLLQLPTEIRTSLAAEEITEGHARAILGAPSTEQQIRLWQRVRERNLTVRQTETAAKQVRAATQPGRTATAPGLPGDRLAQERLQASLSTHVQVQRGRRGGKLIIRWYDDEQLEQLVALIARRTDDQPPPPPNEITI